MAESEELKLIISVAHAKAQKALKAVTGMFKSFGKGILNTVKRAAKSIFSLKTAILSLAGAGGIGLLFKNLTNASKIQEKAELDLAAAMESTKTFTKEAHDELLAFAAERQKITIFGDELTIQNMALLQSFQMNTEQIKKSTIAAQDLASGLGIDLRTATLLVGKAFAGDTATLSRYGIKVEEGLDASQKFAAVLEQIQQRFGGRAEAEVNTYAGAMQQLSNLWGDMKETLGKGLLPVMRDLVTNYLKPAVIYINDWAKANEALIQQKFSDYVNTAVDVFWWLYDVWVELKSIGSMFVDTLIGLWGYFTDTSTLSEFGNSLTDKILNIMWEIADAIDAAAYWVVQFYDKLKTTGTIDNFIKLISDLGGLIWDVLKYVFDVNVEFGNWNVSIEDVNDALKTMIGWVDKAKEAVDGIIGKLEQLRGTQAQTAREMNESIQSLGLWESVKDFWSNALDNIQIGGTNAYSISPTDVMGTHPTGAARIPADGLYRLERGERVISNDQVQNNSYTFNFGGGAPQGFDQEHRFRRLLARPVTI